MEYSICVVVEANSTTTQRRSSIGDDVLLGALAWEIWIEQHTFNLLLQQYIKGHAIRSQYCAVVESDSTTTQK